MNSEVNAMKEWIDLYQRSYLIAKEEKCSQILSALIDQLQRITPDLILQCGEEKILKMFSEMVSALERKDLVYINDILEYEIRPLLDCK